MLKLIWFFIKITLLIWLILWLVNRPGAVVFEWLGYHVETSVGLVIAFIILFSIVVAQLYRLWRSLVTMPAWFKRYQDARLKEKGYAALTKGLVAVAAGNKKQAQKQAARVRKLIPHEALGQLLAAQSALLNSDHSTAENYFYQLIENRDTAFLGVRGLLIQAIQQKKFDHALLLIRRADYLYPKTAWVLKTRLDLEIELTHWQEALETVKRLKKIGALEGKIANSHLVALQLLMTKEAEKNGLYDLALTHARAAWRLDRHHVPATLYYISLLARNNQGNKAVSIFEKTWKETDHPKLSSNWLQLAPREVLQASPLTQIKWIKKLLTWQPHSNEAKLTMGLAFLHAELWGEARLLLEQVAKEGAEHKTGKRTYKALAELERRQYQDKTKENYWLEKEKSILQNEQWTCHHCGHHFDEWQAICLNCHSFDQVNWGLATDLPSSSLYLPKGKTETFLSDLSDDKLTLQQGRE